MLSHSLLVLIPESFSLIQSQQFDFKGYEFSFLCFRLRVFSILLGCFETLPLPSPSRETNGKETRGIESFILEQTRFNICFCKTIEMLRL